MLHVEATTTVRAPRQTVLDVYGDYPNWPRLFPTISAVRVLGRHGPTLVLEVDHVEGKVLNRLVVRPPDAVDLWEEKRRYDARFSNRFETAPDGTRFTVYGDIYLKGWARLLQPFLRGYVRRRIQRLQLQPVKAEAEARALGGQGRLRRPAGRRPGRHGRSRLPAADPPAGRWRRWFRRPRTSPPRPEGVKAADAQRGQAHLPAPPPLRG